MRVLVGDCLDLMAGMETNSVDTIVTDPPYGLEFMGKEWDHGVPGVPFWKAALHVAKPGAMLLAFGGTRTHHRLMCAIEDAGWELRDTVCWLYGSGFPKSHDISKAIDKAAGAEREIVGRSSYASRRPNPMAGTTYGYNEQGYDISANLNITAPATDAAQLWDGWGTALKPAWEPIIVAMKPRDGTFANNALKWDVAGLWVDGGRVPTNGDKAKFPAGIVSNSESVYGSGLGLYADRSRPADAAPQGRWPANLILDEAAAAMLDEQSGESKPRPVRPENIGKSGDGTSKGLFGMGSVVQTGYYDESSKVSRFFYMAKASRAERNNGIEGVTLELEVCLCDANMEQGTLLERAISALVMELEGRECNTTSNGNGPTGLFHRVTLSITSTATSKTIDSKTWNVLISQPTSAFIAAVIRTLQEYGSSLVATVESISQSLSSMSERAGSVRGAKTVVSETPWRISASAKPTTNFHPTCKPLALMRYLVRLTKTPTGGVVLDPFMGSGTTGMACVLEDRNFVGIEIDPDYAEIARRRIEATRPEPKQAALWTS